MNNEGRMMYAMQQTLKEKVENMDNQCDFNEEKVKMDIMFDVHKEMKVKFLQRQIMSMMSAYLRDLIYNRQEIDKAI